MSTPIQDGAYLVLIDQPLTKEHAAAHAAAISAVLDEAPPGSALRLVIPSPESPDAAGLAVLLAASKECRARSMELRIRLAKELAELAVDLRLAKLAVLETPEGAS